MLYHLTAMTISQIVVLLNSKVNTGTYRQNDSSNKGREEPRTGRGQGKKSGMSNIKKVLKNSLIRRPI